MNITVRRSRPEDAKLIAWCMLMAGRSHLKIGILDLMISQPEAKCLEFLEMLTLQGPRHMSYYTEFLVAEVDGNPAGALTAYDPVTNGEVTMAEPMAAVIKKMGLTEEDMAPGRKSIEAFLTCHVDFAPGAWVVEHVATRPEYRGMGVISKLLQAILDEGRKQGFRLAQVAFYIGNIPGERSYKKAGFTYFDEKRHPAFEKEIGCPGLVRMLRDI